jgi:hypothetical protein
MVGDVVVANNRTLAIGYEGSREPASVTRQVNPTSRWPANWIDGITGNPSSNPLRRIITGTAGSGG